MATIGTLFVNIGTKLDGLRSGLNNANTMVSQAKGKFSALGSAIKTGLIGAAGAGVVALGALGASITNTSLELSDSMNLIQARTGATTQEMSHFRDTTVNIFNKNLGDSLSDVADAMGTVKSVTQATGDELENIATDGLILRKVFDKDIGESVRAVDTAMETFGDTSTTTFDMLTTVIQRTGDPADDLLDTVNEYAIVLDQAGFTSQQFFGILESGLNAGAMNFDVVADAVKEFQIRIVDGSDTTTDALNELFVAVGEGNQEIVDLQNELGETTFALAENQAALESAEGAYAASEAVVDELGQALKDAQRELKGLASPNLAGMEAFDNQLFALEMQAKQAKLALLDTVKGTDAYDAAKANLEAINTQMDRISLERDLTIEPQLRAIEQAANGATGSGGSGGLVTFEEAMSRIAHKKGEIAELEGAFTSATAEMEANGLQVESLTAIQDGLVANIAQIEASLESADNPAREFLSGLSDGSMTGADAMSQVIQKLQEVEDPVLQNQIGVALFGSLWENLGPQVILALDPAQNALQGFEGATKAAGEAVNQGLGPAWETFKRTATTALLPLGDLIATGMSLAIPYLVKFGDWLAIVLPDAIATLEGWITNTILPALTNFGNWFINEGWPALQALLQPILAQLIPGLIQIAEWAGQLASAVLPLLSQAWQWMADNMNIVLPILGAVGLAVMAFTAPISFVVAGIAALAMAWANNWGDIQGKTATFVAWWQANVQPSIDEAFAWIVDIALPTLAAAWDTAWAGVQAVIDRVLPILKSAFQMFQAAFNGDWYLFGEKLGEVWDGAWGLIADVLEGIGATFISLMDTAIANLIDFIFNTDWASVGWGIIEGIALGISNGISLIEDAATGAAQAALDSAKGFLGISSPSTVTEKILGNNMVGGIVRGLVAGRSLVSGAMEKLVGGNMVTGLVSRLGEGQKKVQGAIANWTPGNLQNRGQATATASTQAPGQNVVFEAGSIVVHVGNGDPATITNATANGVLRALRNRGLR